MYVHKATQGSCRLLDNGPVGLSDRIRCRFRRIVARAGKAWFMSALLRSYVWSVALFGKDCSLLVITTLATKVHYRVRTGLLSSTLSWDVLSLVPPIEHVTGHIPIGHTCTEYSPRVHSSRELL